MRSSEAPLPARVPMSAGVEPIAVIGLACRMPGAPDAKTFWTCLRDGAHGIRDFTQEELLAAGWSRSLLEHPGFVGSRGALDGIDLFDAAFFGFTAHEASITDPQHRLFLECAWETLEDGGYDPRQCDGRVGVFGSTSINTYLGNVLSNRDIAERLGSVQLRVASDKDHLCTRVAYKLDLRGPAVTIQSASSSSLVAVASACDSLVTGQCDMALAGGVSASARQIGGYVHEEGDMTSPDGRCRAFDWRANGTVGGSGVALVLLKRLSDALTDGDAIRAVIRGWAVNNDGGGKVGYTAPSVRGQAEVIAEAHAAGGISADTVTYVEAHGTGTPIGDSIEIEALTQAFRATTKRRSFCAIGSVKTNIGELDVAAGVAGLVKTVLALEHRTLPPSLNFEKPNPELRLEDTPFVVNSALQEWRSAGVPRRAGVSSFGIGGTNAHVVVEEAPASQSGDIDAAVQVLCLSARSAAALDRATIRLATHLDRCRSLDVADVAYTLAAGRRSFAHRRAVCCRNIADAVAALTADAPQSSWTGVAPSRQPRIAFAFPGEGSQCAGMALTSYESEPVVRQEIDRCATILRPHLGVDLREGLLEAQSTSAREIERGSLAQPAIFTMSFAWARALQTYGIRPAMLVGRGVGEYVAAVVAGVMSLEDALRVVVAARARAADGLHDVLESVIMAAPQLPIASTATGLWVSAVEVVSSHYWQGAASGRGRFAQAFDLVLAEADVLLEVGPGHALTDIAQIAEPARAVALASLPHPSGADRGEPVIPRLLARLWTNGVPIDWDARVRGRRRKVPLPTYPFERQRYWISPDEIAGAPAAASFLPAAQR